VSVSLRVRSVDRIYLQAYVPRLMSEGLLVRFLLDRGATIPSPALLGQIGTRYIAAIERHTRVSGTLTMPARAVSSRACTYEPHHQSAGFIVVISEAGDEVVKLRPPARLVGDHIGNDDGNEFPQEAPTSRDHARSSGSHFRLHHGNVMETTRCNQAKDARLRHCRNPRHLAGSAARPNPLKQFAHTCHAGGPGFGSRRSRTALCPANHNVLVSVQPLRVR
jgi:hypothetical protein